MLTEDIPPGQAIPAHRHAHADEIIFIHGGIGLASLAGQQVPPIFEESPGLPLYFHAVKQYWPVTKGTLNRLGSLTVQATSPFQLKLVLSCSWKCPLHRGAGGHGSGPVSCPQGGRRSIGVPWAICSQ